MKPKLLLGLALLLVGVAMFIAGISNAALIYPPGPDGGLQIVRNKISEIHRDDPYFGELGNGNVSINNAHLWCAIGVSDVISGHMLPGPSAKKCWRYPLMRGPNFLGLATVFTTETNNETKLEFGGLYKTCGGEETLTVQRMAENWPQVKSQDYEVRYLTVLNFSFAAIWLHGKSDDILVPLPPVYGRKLTGYQPYSERQLVKALKPEAEQWLIDVKAENEQERARKQPALTNTFKTPNP